MNRTDHDKSLREHLVNLLTKEEAHAGFDKAVADLPAKLRGKRPEGSPHSAWELLEHLRLAQWDIVEFSKDARHKSPAWPSGYWPKNPAPPDDAAWEHSIEEFRKDLDTMVALIQESPDLYAPLPHGDGQTLLREALLLADHNAYHVGEIVLLRRLLGAWG
jgi:DinB superfamily